MFRRRHLVSSRPLQASIPGHAASSSRIGQVSEFAASAKRIASVFSERGRKSKCPGMSILAGIVLGESLCRVSKTASGNMRGLLVLQLVLDGDA